MMNDRDMYYNSYGYGGFVPNNGMPIPMQPGYAIPMQNQSMPSQSTYSNGQLNDMNERMSRLERQVKRLEQRLTRLETPYANSNNFQSQEPDNNMYMM